MRVVLVVRLLLVAGILLVSRALLADPAPCDVHILRAPDRAKAVIEARMRAEPTCETSLVVRVVPTSRGGLYLLAHTPNGHVYELVARDARTAADLVALWASSREPAGLGAVHSELSGYLYDGGMTSLATQGVYPVGEVGLEVTRALGARWAFAAGPLATIYSQSYRLDTSTEMLGSRDFDVSLLGGLRRKL